MHKKQQLAFGVPLQARRVVRGRVKLLLHDRTGTADQQGRLQDQFSHSHGVPPVCSLSLAQLKASTALSSASLWAVEESRSIDKKVTLLKNAWDRGQQPLKCCNDSTAVSVLA